MSYYRPSDERPSFAGIRTFMRLPHLRDVADVDFAVIGLPFDTASCFRVGARLGPEAIRSASMMLRPYHSEQRVAIFDVLGGVDYGDAPVVPGSVDESLESIEEILCSLHAHRITPIALGGDHSVTLGELRAAAQTYGPMGLLLFDSHPDTWNSYLGHERWHSSWVRRATEEGLIDVSHSIMCGLRGSTYAPDDWDFPLSLGFEFVTAAEIHERGLSGLPSRIQERVGHGSVFLSFDIDFLDPAYAPGTGTPEIGGFTTWEAQRILRELKGIKVVAADIVEVLPAYDSAQITAQAAANIVYEIITLLAFCR